MTQSYSAPVVLELQRAQRVGDALDGVGERVGVVVHGIDGPGVAGAVVVGVADAVEQRVAHLHVRRGQVDPGPQHAGAVGQVAGPHLPEQGQVLLDGAVPVGRGPARLAQAAPVLLDLLVAEVVDVGLARPDEVLGQLVHLVEVVGRVERPLAEVEAQPAHVVLDGLDVLDVLLGRVGVVEAQVAAGAVLLGDAEVEADRLGVADVEVAVGLGREAGQHPAAVLPGAEVVVDDVADEVASRGLGAGAGHDSRLYR